MNVEIGCRYCKGKMIKKGEIYRCPQCKVAKELTFEEYVVNKEDKTATHTITFTYYNEAT